MFIKAVRIKNYGSEDIWKSIDGDDIFKIAGFDEEIYISICGKLGEDTSINIYKGYDELDTQIDVAMGEHQGYMDSRISLNLL